MGVQAPRGARRLHQPNQPKSAQRPRADLQIGRGSSSGIHFSLSDQGAGQPAPLTSVCHFYRYHLIPDHPHHSPTTSAMFSSAMDIDSDHGLHIDASVAISLCEQDVEMWDDDTAKILTLDDLDTPTAPDFLLDANEYPCESALRCFRRRSGLTPMMSKARGRESTNVETTPSWPVSAGPSRMEPSKEPCTDEIPWTDLVYWLGNATTGQVECSCGNCRPERSHGRAASMPPHYHQQKLSAKIPFIRMPRIEGVN